jgi:uncharacterized protein (TIGR03084 family)
MKEICRDLQDEYQVLDDIVSKLDEAGWALITHCAGWSIKDQISHIAFFDAAAREAVTDADAFARSAELLFKDLDSIDSFNQRTLARGRQMSIKELLTWWRTERSLLLRELSGLDPKNRLPWYGPPMSAKSFATARLMETWAHGQDVADVLKIRRVPGERLRHIAHLGVRTFGWSFTVHNLPVPDKQVRVELTAPSGSIWSWGPENAADLVRGPAEDFCLVVTQRRNVADTRLEVNGDAAVRWMSLAQAFAGPPDNGPPQGMFR